MLVGVTWAKRPDDKINSMEQCTSHLVEMGMLRHTNKIIYKDVHIFFGWPGGGAMGPVE